MGQKCSGWPLQIKLNLYQERASSTVKIIRVKSVWAIIWVSRLQIWPLKSDKPLLTLLRKIHVPTMALPSILCELGIIFVPKIQSEHIFFRNFACGALSAITSISQGWKVPRGPQTLGAKNWIHSYVELETLRIYLTDLGDRGKHIR